VLAAIERAMITIRRRQTRRSLGSQAAREAGKPVDLNLLAVVDAVEEGQDQPNQEVTVGVVAERLGIDPSRASRVVAAAVDAAYVRRVASQGDGRRICLELTDVGRQVVEDAHRTRQAFYQKLLNGWPEHERAELARLLTKFTASMTDVQTP
jgi:DNA-binding MarR family transcriptional regulator